MGDAIWLPEQIGAGYVVNFALELSVFRKDQGDAPICLEFGCNEGGNSEAAFAIAQLIKADGNVHAYMRANISSAATVIFSSCVKRYVYPMTRMGFHIGYWDDVKMRLDAKILRALLDQFESSDRHMCEVYATASNKSAKWWRALLNRNTYGVWLDAKELVSIGMAEWVNS